MASEILAGPDSAASTELANAVKDSNARILYDSKVGEYQISYRVMGEDGRARTIFVPIRYDPISGRALRSRRAELFAEPSPEEELRVLSLIENCRDIKSVIAKVGNPDSTLEVDGGKQYFFKKSSTEVDLIIHERNGQIQASVGPKQTKQELDN